MYLKFWNSSCFTKWREPYQAITDYYKPLHASHVWREVTPYWCHYNFSLLIDSRSCCTWAHKCFSTSTSGCILLSPWHLFENIFSLEGSAREHALWMVFVVNRAHTKLDLFVTWPRNFFHQRKSDISYWEMCRANRTGELARSNDRSPLLLSHQGHASVWEIHHCPDNVISTDGVCWRSDIYNRLLMNKA